MEVDLIALVLADSALDALVGNRIHWNVLPQAVTNPCVVMYRIDGVPAYAMLGPTGLVFSRIQIDVRAATYLEAVNAKNALEAVLSGYTGTIGSTVFRGIFKLSERHRSERPGGSETYHIVSSDFDVWHIAAS